MSRAALALLAALAFPAPAGAADEPPPRAQADASARVARMDGALAQLAHARRLKLSIGRRKPCDRDFWRTLAVEAYRAVRGYWPEERALGAEAAFRAGELLRAAEDAEGALVEFRAAQDLGKGTPFRARARLEIGHVHRREGAWRAALDEYLAVAGDASAAPEQRDDAWLWAGRIWQEEGRLEDARRAWSGVAEGVGDPLDRVQAFDEIGLSWLDAGERASAAETLERCRTALQEASLEESELGNRTRAALGRMRTAALLERSVPPPASGGPRSPS